MSRGRGREYTLFEAVAGRVRLLTSTSSTRDDAAHVGGTIGAHPGALPPEDVLFSRGGAPDRHVEDDFYWASRRLDKRQRLPDSDLLKAVHAYASDFYSHGPGKGEPDFHSMNETALLAVGILLEEAVTHLLGDRGDMAFVEAQPVTQDEHQQKDPLRDYTRPRSYRRRSLRALRTSRKYFKRKARSEDVTRGASIKAEALSSGEN